MTQPRLAHECDLAAITLSPRFSVEQGKKPDGSLKVRPVDDMTRSGCNEATAPSEKLEYESLDLFLKAIKEMEQRVGKDISFWKADIDSAFRRIPIRQKDREFAHVVFLHNGNVIIAKHLAMMFGGISSVHHWERVGTALVAYVLLGTVYVCDLF